MVSTSSVRRYGAADVRTINNNAVAKPIVRPSIPINKYHQHALLSECPGSIRASHGQSRVNWLQQVLEYSTLLMFSSCVIIYICIIVLSHLSSKCNLVYFQKKGTIRDTKRNLVR